VTQGRDTSGGQVSAAGQRNQVVMHSAYLFLDAWLTLSHRQTHEIPPTRSLLADAALDGITGRRADYDHFFSFCHHSPPSSENCR